jgi:hypothetical protein
MKQFFFLILLIIPLNLMAEKAWVQKHYIEYESFRTFQSLDSNNCYAFVDGVGFTIIYKSTDQGNSWWILYKKDHLKLNDSIWKVFHCQALDSEYIYISYMDRTILDRSTDGGKTFDRISFGDLSLAKNRLFIDLVMYDRKLGSGCTYDDLIITRDNWESYRIIKMTEYSTAGDPMFFIDSNNIAIMKWSNFGHEFLKYNIEKNEWSLYNKGEEPQNGENPKAMYFVFFVNDSLGFGCGGQGTGQGNFARDIIWKTTDRGLHWKVVLNRAHEPVFGLAKISFTNELHGMAVGNWGKIVETTDGGQTWTYLEVPKDAQGSIGFTVTWAGQYPLIACQAAGIFRLEETTGIDEMILNSNDVQIRQTNDKLLISVEDESFRKYNLQIYDISGNMVLEQELNSGIGVLFMPVYINRLITGSYFYRISVNDEIVKTGKFVR